MSHTPRPQPDCWPTPLDPHVAKIAATLDDTRREAFEVRAAIVEHEAGIDRLNAERRALLDTLATYGLPTPLTLLQGHMAGVSRYLLTSDAAAAECLLLRAGCQPVRNVPIVATLGQRFSCVAELIPALR